MIDGAPVKMGGKEWVVPALSFGQLRRLMPQINSLAGFVGVPSDEQIDGMGAIIHAALSRNYPEVTLEEVIDMLDLSNAANVLMAVMGQAGLVQSGEPKAGNP